VKKYSVVAEESVFMSCRSLDFSASPACRQAGGGCARDDNAYRFMFSYLLADKLVDITSFFIHSY